jgi:hypothetical protein
MSCFFWLKSNFFIVHHHYYSICVINARNPNNQTWNYRNKYSKWVVRFYTITIIPEEMAVKRKKNSENHTARVRSKGKHLFEKCLNESL